MKYPITIPSLPTPLNVYKFKNSNSHLKMVRQPAHAKIRIPLEYPGHNEQTYAVSLGQVEEQDFDLSMDLWDFYSVVTGNLQTAL